ncbi:hypothetical protein KKB18_12550 [bacterium]|nr:hypothetical protein [bacterium]
MNKLSFRCPDCNNILIPKPMSNELECKKCGSDFKRDKDGTLHPLLSTAERMKTELRAMQHENPFLKAQLEAEEKAQAHLDAEKELLETRMNVNEIKQLIRQRKKEYTIYIILIAFFSFAFAVVFGSKYLQFGLPAALIISILTTILFIGSYKKFKKQSSYRLKELKSKAKGLEFATYGDMNQDYSNEL